MSQNEREALRAKNNLDLITKNDEGLSWRKVASGVYGFSYTPASQDGGMFAKQPLLSFEMHKYRDGTLHVVAYGNSEEAEKLTRAGSPELLVFPSPQEGSEVLLSIPHARIATAKELDRDQKNRLRLTLKALS